MTEAIMTEAASLSEVPVIMSRMVLNIVVGDLDIV